MKHTPALSRYQTERDQQLSRLLAALAQDPRVREAWLFGSLARGTADALSDIDLIITVRDEHLAAVIEQRHAFAEPLGPPLFTLDAPQNAPPGGGYLMVCLDAPSAPHLLDLYWQSERLAWDASQARRVFAQDAAGTGSPVTRPASGDRSAGDALPHAVRYFWMMLLITAKYAARQPQAPELHLLPYLYPAYMEALRLVPGALHEPLSQPAEFGGPLEKLALLRGMAGQIGQHAAPLLPAVRRYLDLIEEAVTIETRPA